MGLFDDQERRFAETLSELAHENPFSPERVLAERAVLGVEFADVGPVWSATRGDDPSEPHPERPNVALLRQRSWKAAERARSALERLGSGVGDKDLALYEDLALYALFARYETSLYELTTVDARAGSRFAGYARFEHDFERLMHVPGVKLPTGLTGPHTLALFFQLRRAFHFIFRYILGGSRPAAQLRGETWCSVFTHDLRRYRKVLYGRMADIPTLIVGASGTGKELVAQAIGRSRYLAFDAKQRRFVESFSSQFHPLNMAALAPNLVEAELFGHRRGAFTGALEDRQGFLERSGPEGTVFLDEIGELAPALQVKLLRVLQTRSFMRVGDGSPRVFLGKVVAATHRDLERGLEEGWFREDLYYRLCADRIDTPTLRTRLKDDPTELELLVDNAAIRLVGPELGAALARETLAFIECELGEAYPWPGNIRELEQCLRNVMVRRRYRPARRARGGDSFDALLLESGLSSDELLDRYSLLVYRETGSYAEAGRRLGLDRRTVKQRVDRTRA